MKIDEEHVETSKKKKKKGENTLKESMKNDENQWKQPWK